MCSPKVLVIALASALLVSSPALATTMDTPPDLGDVAVRTVPKGDVNTIWYLSPSYFFSMQGQSIKLKEPIRLNAVAIHVNMNLTVLTPFGQRVLANNSNPPWEDEQFAKKAERPLHVKGRKIPARVTTQVYRVLGDQVPRDLDLRDPSFVLVAETTSRKPLVTDQWYVSEFEEQPELPPGNYIITWNVTETPKSILSLIFTGAQSGYRGEREAYPGGTAFHVPHKPPGGPHLREHTTKVLDRANRDFGTDDWCRGDLSVVVYGEPIDEATPTELGKPAWSDLEPYEPAPWPKTNRGECWSSERRTW